MSRHLRWSACHAEEDRIGTDLPRHLQPEQRPLDLSPTEHLSEEDFVKWTRRVTPQPGDIVFSYETRLGQAAIIPEGMRCCLGRRMALMRPDPSKVVPRFLLYAYLAPEFQEALRSRTVHGSTVDRILLTEFASFPIRIPPLSEQRAIVELLGAIDDKIELNRRTNQTLEAIARAIFKSWFVDFDPVRAKMAGRNPMVPPDLTDLFPSKLVDSPIGPVPEGWDVAPLTEHVEVARGLSYRGADLVEQGEGLPLHNLNSVLEGGGYKYEGIKYYAGDYQDRHLVEPGDVIVANTEQGHEYLLIGYPAIVPRTFGSEGMFSADLFCARPRGNSQVTRPFLYLLLLSSRLHAEVVGYTGGTTVNHLSVEGLRRPRVAVPSAEIITRFEAMIAPLFDETEHLVEESRTLARLRDWLLPGLVSGRVRVARESGSARTLS